MHDHCLLQECSVGVQTPPHQHPPPNLLLSPSPPYLSVTSAGCAENMPDHVW